MDAYNQGETGLSSGAIVGIVIGSIVFFWIALIVWSVIHKKRLEKRQALAMQEVPQQDPESGKVESVTREEQGSTKDEEGGVTTVYL